MTQLNIPYKFVAGTKAKASEVNANFEAVANEIDEIYTQINENSTNSNSEYNSLNSKINEINEQFEAFLNTYSQISKFSVNSGKINTETKTPNILTANSTIISFNVDALNPLIATNYKGETFCIEAIDDLFLPSLIDGIYTIYVNKEGEIFYYSNLVQYVDILPFTPYINQICYVKGTEPISVKKYTSDGWVEFLGVPVGYFKIESNTITKLETFAYNQNGYNVNINGFPHLFEENGWTKLPNGLILQWGKYEFQGTQTYNFPIEFPNSCFGIISGDNFKSITSGVQVNVEKVSNTQFKISGASGSTASAYIFAYGY